MKCPIDNAELTDMGHLAKRVFKPCPECGREWYYTEDNSLQSKKRQVSVNFSKLVPGGDINEAIKPKPTTKQLVHMLYDYIYVSSRMRDRYAEGDDAIKAELHRNLYSLEDKARELIGAWPIPALLKEDSK